MSVPLSRVLLHFLRTKQIWYTTSCGISSLFLSAYHSPHAVPDRLRLRVNRISLQEYESMQFDKERLRDICKISHNSVLFSLQVL